VSLINQMLKDLEQRSKGRAQLDSALFDLQAVETREGRPKWFYFLTLLALALILILVWHYSSSLLFTPFVAAPTASLQTVSAPAQQSLSTELTRPAKAVTPPQILSGLNPPIQNQAAKKEVTPEVGKKPSLNLSIEQAYFQALEPYKEGDNEKALSLTERALEQEPAYLPLIELKARLLEKQGQVLEALQLLLKDPPPLDLKPDHYALIAALYQRLGQYPEAVQVYERLTKVQPERGLWWLGLAAALEGAGQQEQAQKAYAKAKDSSDLSPELKSLGQHPQNS